MSVSLAELAATSRKVGVPIAERSLTAALDLLAPQMFTPGCGRSLIHLREVDIAPGRPDAVLLVVSSAALRARQRGDLRLPSLAHARVLESTLTGTRHGYCPSHVNRLKRSLRDCGWLAGQDRVRPFRSLIRRSVIVEAKMSDWRKGVGQLVRARWAGHEAALLMPSDLQHRVSRTMLRHNWLGLLAAHQDAITWQIKSPRREIRWAADLWLSELAMRSVEAGQA